MTFFDVGKRNISQGAFVRNGFGVGVMQGGTGVAAMMCSEPVGTRSNVLSAFALRASYHIVFNAGQRLNAGFMLIHDNANSAVKAMNYGLLLGTKIRRHWELSSGIHFRHYYLASKAKKELGISDNGALIETWNLMYKFGYVFFKESSKMNVSFNMTNIDYFHVNQVTNPMFNVIGTWKFRDDWQLFASAWYRSAGMLNGSINPYEFFFRAGIKWRFED